MPTKLPSQSALLAPGAAGGALRTYAPSAGLPAVDDSLLREDSRAELIDGVLRFVPPSEEPHATSNFDLPTVLGPFLKPEFRGAVDMLTRTGHTTNFAPDVSVYPRERDPATGRRQVDQLSFEIVSASTLEDTAYKARKLVERGVRRVFAVDVEAGALLEWSDAQIAWSHFAPDAVLDDPCLIEPVPVKALLSGILSDEQLVRALEARGSLALRALRAREHEEGRARGVEVGRAEGRAEGREEGREEGHREAMRSLFSVRIGRPLTDSEAAALRTREPAAANAALFAMQGEALAAWLARPDR